MTDEHVDLLDSCRQFADASRRLLGAISSTPFARLAGSIVTALRHLQAVVHQDADVARSLKDLVDDEAIRPPVEMAASATLALPSDDRDLLECCRQFARASEGLLRAISSTRVQHRANLAESIVSALGQFPPDAYEDAEVVESLDNLVVDEVLRQSADIWVTVNLALAWTGLERRTAHGLIRAIHISEVADTVVDRRGFPRAWAAFQLVEGHIQRLTSREDSTEPLQHYRNVLDAIGPEDDPTLWAAAAEGLASGYTRSSGDRADNLRRARELLSEIEGVWEREGHLERVADTRVALGDIHLEANEGRDSERALKYYRDAFAVFNSLGKDREAVAVADKIGALAPVEFTAYYPRTGAAGRRYSFVVYAHLPELASEVNVDVGKFALELGGHTPRPRRTRTGVKLAPDTPITIVPECEHGVFDPPHATKKWDGAWSRFLFDFRTAQDIPDDDVVVVHISIQVAGIEIASIKNCAVEIVDSKRVEADSENPLAQSKASSRTSPLYQKIFVSYSRMDSEITKAYAAAQLALGNETFIDVDNLRAGEDWKPALAQAIDHADVFQLFWSKHSASSEFCRHEWSYARESRCPHDRCEGFIRPVYWEKPMPAPPPELSELTFKYVPFEGTGRKPKAVSRLIRHR